MLFEFGKVKVSEPCPNCKTVHHNIAIGEEALACRCGGVFKMYATEDDQIIYGWVSPEEIQQVVTERINDDKRNLC